MTWKPGTSGHPGGRARYKPFLEALRMELAAAGDDNKKLRDIARKVIAEAEDGNLEAVKIIWDRLEGKPIQQVDVTATVEQVSQRERLQRIKELQSKIIDAEVVMVPAIPQLGGSK